MLGRGILRRKSACGTVPPESTAAYFGARSLLYQDIIGRWNQVACRCISFKPMDTHRTWQSKGSVNRNYARFIGFIRVSNMATVDVCRTACYGRRRMCIPLFFIFERGERVWELPSVSASIRRSEPMLMGAHNSSIRFLPTVDESSGLFKTNGSPRILRESVCS